MNGLVFGFKLFVSVLSVSETGSIARTAYVVDLPTEQQCMQMAQQLNNTSSRAVGGHNITTEVKSDCVPIGPPVAFNRMPPPIAGMVRGFINEMR